MFPFVLEGSLELCVRLKTFRVKTAGGRDGVPRFNSREGPCPVWGVLSLNRQKGVLHEKRQRPRSLFVFFFKPASLRSGGRQGIGTDAEDKKAKSPRPFGPALQPCRESGRQTFRKWKREKRPREALLRGLAKGRRPAGASDSKCIKGKGTEAL